MLKSRGSIMHGVGARLRKLRKSLNLESKEMASRLGLHVGSYYKNESDRTVPGLTTLYRLHKEMKISMDWLLFDHGSMRLQEKQVRQGQEEEQPPRAEPIPEIKELLAYMEKDPLLRHQVLIDFHRYKQEREEAK